VRAENTVIEKEDGLPPASQAGGLKEGRYIKISIEDQGVGISKGGLGLTTAYSIIKSHDGYMNVESKLGEGTRFDIYLPASEKKIVKKEVVEEMLPAGKGKILLMDDEEIVVDVARKMLESLGYEVESTSDGAEAIDLYKKAKESGNPFDVVIMDLTVPGGIGGKEAIKRLLEIDPGVRAIVSSGYSNDPVMSDFKRYGFKGVVAKPYNLKNLAEEVHKIIAE